MSRLRSQARRLQSDATLKQQYVAAMQAYEDGDYSEPATSEEARRFLHHHAVIGSDKETTKDRIVFDGSAATKGEKSLNETLLPGPALNPEVFTLLLAFRFQRIALVADVEKAFLRICMREEDRSFLRYLWFKENDIKNGEFIEMQMKVVPFGLSSSPFLLAFVINHHLDKFKEEKEVWIQLKNRFYVDDLVSGESSVERATHLKKRATEILASANMKL